MSMEQGKKYYIINKKFLIFTTLVVYPKIYQISFVNVWATKIICGLIQLFCVS